MSKLTEKAVALLQEGEVNLVIGYEEGNHGTRPLFCLNGNFTSRKNLLTVLENLAIKSNRSLL